MVGGIATGILCGICDEVCTRGSQLQCCGARGCRACAVNKIAKDSKCWKCDKKVKLTVDLFDDSVLRKAVNSFKKDGKLKAGMEKLLQKTSSGENVAKKRKTSDEKKERTGKTSDRPDGSNKKRTWTTMEEKWEQPCFRGNKCKLKGKACLFNHDDDELRPKKANTNKSKDNRKKGATPTKNATAKTPTKVDKHPGKIDKPCNYGSSCRKMDCKFKHKNEGLRRKMSSGGLGQMMSTPMGMSGLSTLMGMSGHGGAMGGSDMATYLQMQNMKTKLEKMMSGYMGRRF